MSEEIHDARRRRLKKVIKESHNNDYIEVARKINRSSGTLRKYLAPNSDRPISDTLARSIERALELPDDYLDVGETQKNLVYFVFLSLTQHSPDVVEWVYESFPQVIDCSTVYGEFDIFIKVSVPNTHQLEIFYSRIIQHPKVVKTRTFPTVNNIRFQRKQSDFIHLENQLDSNSFISKQKKRRIETLLWEINSIEKKDRMVINESKDNVIHPVEIMNSVQQRFWSTRYYGEYIRAKSRYFQKEKSKIKSGVESKRIFLLQNEFEVREQDSSVFEEMIKTAGELEEIGCEVRFLQEGNWLPSENTQKAKSFAIIDKAYVYTREQGIKDARLDYNDAYIERCINLFKANWSISHPLEKFQPLERLTLNKFFRILNALD